MPVELTRVFRQSDAGFVALLTDLRSGIVTADSRCARAAVPPWHADDSDNQAAFSQVNTACKAA